MLRFFVARERDARHCYPAEDCCGQFKACWRRRQHTVERTTHAISHLHLLSKLWVGQSEDQGIGRPLHVPSMRKMMFPRRYLIAIPVAFSTSIALASLSAAITRPLPIDDGRDDAASLTDPSGTRANDSSIPAFHAFEEGEGSLARGLLHFASSVSNITAVDGAVLLSVPTLTPQMH